MCRMIRVIVVLQLSLLFVAGCASTATNVSSPKVVLSSVEMQSLSFSGQTFLLRFDVSNPNPFPLPVRSVRYHVRLGEHRFASGETQANFSVPAGGADAFAISVDLNIMQQTSRVTSLLRTGMSENVQYELQGSLLIDVPNTRPLAFSSSGVIPINSAF
jgi:LEA14-like dessication related protein